MKLLYLSNALVPSRQANSIHVLKICSAFSKINFEVSLICQNNIEDESKNDEEKIFKFYGIEKKFKIYALEKYKSVFSSYVYAFKSFFIALYKRPRIIVSRFILSGFLCSIFFDTYIELHQLPHKNSRIQKYLLNILRFCPRFRGLIVISKPLKKIFHDIGFSNEMIHVLPDGADTPEKVDKSLKIDYRLNDKFKVGYTGHLYKGRGIDLLISIAKTCSWLEMNIVGGNENDIIFYKQKVKKMGINNIKIHGFLEPSKIFKFNSNMDVLVAPYQKKIHLESGDTTTEKWMSPLKIFEYMATGKPIICSRIEVLNEVLEDNRNCLLCDPEKEEEWINAIKKVKNDNNLREKISKEAYSDLVNKFSWRKRAEKIRDLHLKIKK